MKVTAASLPPRWSPPLTEGPQCSLCTQCSLTSAVRSPCPIAEWDTASGPFSCSPTTRPRQLEAIICHPHTDSRNRLPPKSTSPCPLARAEGRRKRRRRRRQRRLIKRKGKVAGAEGCGLAQEQPRAAIGHRVQRL